MTVVILHAARAIVQAHVGARGEVLVVEDEAGPGTWRVDLLCPICGAQPFSFGGGPEDLKPAVLAEAARKTADRFLAHHVHQDAPNHVSASTRGPAAGRAPAAGPARGEAEGYNARKGEAPGLDPTGPGPGAKPTFPFAGARARSARRGQVREMTAYLERHWAGVASGWSDYRRTVGANLAGLLIDEQLFVRRTRSAA